MDRSISAWLKDEAHDTRDTRDAGAGARPGEAARILSSVTLDGDPQADKVAARQQAAVTFGAVVPLYLAAVEGRQRAEYHADVRRYLTRHWALLSDLPLGSITRAIVAKRLGELNKSNGSHAADRARANLSGFFSWAIGEGMADGGRLSALFATDSPRVATHIGINKV